MSKNKIQGSRFEVQGLNTDVGAKNFSPLQNIVILEFFSRSKKC